ncbi:MAG TPA: hypothetical protein VMW72_21445, partial [Sedimentisphaerales bacterium]|nr:hypothetical protein [Sedimentisphaerales bacterium]
MKLPFISEKRKDSSSPKKDFKRSLDTGSTPSPDCSEDQSVRGLSELYSPEQASESHVYDIADVLLEMGKINSKQLTSLRKQQQAKPASDITPLLLKMEKISSDDILTATAKIYDLEFRHILPEDVQKEAIEKLDTDFIKSNSVCPIAIEQGTLVVATSEPANVLAIEDVKRQTQMEVRVVVCSTEDVKAVCDSFKDERLDYDLDNIINDMADVEVVQDQEEDSKDLEQMAGQSPVIKFVNYLISNAVREGASDIH